MGAVQVTDGVLDRPSLNFAPGETSAPETLGWASEARSALAARFAELSMLSEDWDSYGARPIDPLALRRTQQLVEAVLRASFPIPWVFPVPDGGVQLEWSAGPVELELEIEPGEEAFVFVCDDDSSGQRFDGELPGGEGLFFLALARVAAHA